MGNLLLEIVGLQCGIWPRGEVAEDFHQPVVSDMPVLLMSGERDPVTPPRYAAQVAEDIFQQPQPGGPWPGAFGHEECLPARYHHGVY